MNWICLYISFSQILKHGFWTLWFRQNRTTLLVFFCTEEQDFLFYPDSCSKSSNNHYSSLFIILGGVPPLVQENPGNLQIVVGMISKTTLQMIFQPKDLFHRLAFHGFFVQNLMKFRQINNSIIFFIIRLESKDFVGVCTLYTVQCTVCWVQCTLHPDNCTQWTVNCTIHQLYTVTMSHRN